MQIVHELVGRRDLGEVAAGSVQDALGLAGGARGVQDEQRVLGGERAGFVLRGCRGHHVVPPQVAPLGPLHVVVAALDDQDVLDGVLWAFRARQRLVDRGLEWAHLAFSVTAVCRDDDLGAGVVDARAQAVGREAAEHHRVHRADAGDGEHRADRLGDHRQVDRDAVALLDAELGQHVREALDLVGELGVGDLAAVARLALPQQRDAVAVACVDVPVEAVVGDVQLAVGEPLRERRVRPVEHFGERLVPVQLARAVGPERLTVGIRLVVKLGRGDRLRGELGGGREAACLVEKVVDLAGHRVPPAFDIPRDGCHRAMSLRMLFPGRTLILALWRPTTPPAGRCARRHPISPPMGCRPLILPRGSVACTRRAPGARSWPR